jgi:hypothetical protein
MVVVGKELVFKGFWAKIRFLRVFLHAIFLSTLIRKK